MIYKPHTVCRACDCPDLLPILDLGEQPLANAFTRDGTTAPLAPLTVLYCPVCTLIQLSVVVDPSILYRPGYAYVQQSRSASMKEHFKALTNSIVIEGGQGRVLEVGSNDGSFLEYLGSRGFYDRHGIDPAATGTEPSTRELFNERNASKHSFDHGKADLVIARHVFAHIDDWKGFIRALDCTTSDDALAVLEVSDSMAVINNTDWPYFYHEHLSLVTRESLDAVLKYFGWKVVNERFFTIHGGSVAYFLRRTENPSQTEGRRLSASDWREFSTRTSEHITYLTNFILTLRDAGATIAGFGAPARASVIASACQFTSDDISFVTDWTPGKIGCLLPGTNIPVVHPDTLLLEQPDYVLMLAYTYEQEILARTSGYRERGGRFILPFPQPHIVG